MPVPDTNTFSLQDVVDVIPDSQTSLQDCFDDSIDALFDSTYKGSKDRLSNFRNYGDSGTLWFYPDGGGNGDVGYSNATWATCRGAGTGNDIDTTSTFSVWVDYTGGDYYIYRGFMRFDLRAIGAGSNCDVAGLGMDLTTSYGGSDTAYAIVGTQGDTLTTADFDAFTFGDYAMSNWVDAPDPPYDDYDAALLPNDAPQLQKIEDAFGDYLYLSFINFTHDQGNSAPSSKSGIEIYRSGGSDDPPGLRIEFSN